MRSYIAVSTLAAVAAADARTPGVGSELGFK